jgi:hypothetical protein
MEYQKKTTICFFSVLRIIVGWHFCLKGLPNYLIQPGHQLLTLWSQNGMPDLTYRAN